MEADPAEGRATILAAARAGYAPARTYLGRSYEGEFGDAVDGESAANAYFVGAMAGDARAQYRYALIYRGEFGRSKDLVDARGWLRHAAKQEVHEAQALLAHIYAHGEGIERDAIEALKWGLLASRGDDSRGRELRQELLAELSESDVAEARRRAEEWLPATRPNPETAIIHRQHARDREAFAPPVP